MTHRWSQRREAGNNVTKKTILFSISPLLFFGWEQGELLWIRIQLCCEKALLRSQNYSIHGMVMEGAASVAEARASPDTLPEETLAGGSLGTMSSRNQESVSNLQTDLFGCEFINNTFTAVRGMSQSPG
jgi:hypothetical protein